ncbi:universal stress protein [Nonomuraea sp. NPDC050680]|uniref:universal stress protein n=1 Tax=Nonomuraea sp. NPDC050680 TaxID=3154630 RepID=UPI0033CEE58B
MARRIVVGVDGSVPSMAAVEWAAADAQRRGLPLRIVHVCVQWPHSPGGPAYCAKALEVAATRARELGAEVTTETPTGDVIDELIGASAPADSVVLGSRGLGGFAGMVLGSVGLAVAGHAAGPVVIVRAVAEDRHDRVVVGYDGSEHSRAAMEYALAQARAQDAELHVVYGWRMPMFSPYAAVTGSLLEDAFQQEVRMARERVASWREGHPDVKITDAEVCEHPVAALIQASETADLVVVGSRGLNAFASAVLGSVSHGVLHHVTCPVAIVRPREETP